MTRIMTQWGTEVSGFGTWDDERKRAVLTRASALIARITDETGIPVFLSYGALLGAVREGGLIAHDFDIDVGFIAPGPSHDEVTAASATVSEWLVGNGYGLKARNNGQFKAFDGSGAHPMMVEFFACWADGDRFYQYFAVPGTARADHVLPLGTVTVDGVPFAAPRQPEPFLGAIYGPGWRTPDPSFKYDLTPELWKPFRFLFATGNRKFWDEYYARRAVNAVWVEEPSGFARVCAERIEPGSRIVEFGCGNGRDGLHFARLGHAVTLTDFSDAAVSHCGEAIERGALGAEAERLNVANNGDVAGFCAARAETFDIAYARFFLHAIEPAAETRVLEAASRLLRPGGRLMVEYRSHNEIGPSREISYENGEHYRRMVVPSELRAKAAGLGLEIEQEHNGFGLAIYGDENPHITRQVFVKTG